VVAVLAVLPAGAVPLGPRFGEGVVGDGRAVGVVAVWAGRRAVAGTTVTTGLFAGHVQDTGGNDVLAHRPPESFGAVPHVVAPMVVGASVTPQHDASHRQSF